MAEVAAVGRDNAFATASGHFDSELVEDDTAVEAAFREVAHRDAVQMQAAFVPFDFLSVVIRVKYLLYRVK